MRITSRKRTIVFAISLGVCLAVAAAVLNVSWIILNWREVVPLVRRGRRRRMHLFRARKSR